MGFICSAILIGSMFLSPTVMTQATESSCMKRGSCSTCQPSANASATELAASLSKEVKQIVAWLKAHPDLADSEDVNSVTAAVQAIYPCH